MAPESSYLLSPSAEDSAPLWRQMAFVFLPAFVAFVGLDVGWIALVAGDMYRAVLGDMLRETPNVVSGLLAWLCIVGALHQFALKGAMSLQSAALRGLALGFFLYGTFTFTNHSVIKTWTWTLAAGDCGWGSLLCGVVTALMFWLSQRFSRPRR